MLSKLLRLAIIKRLFDMMRGRRAGRPPARRGRI
jgi:hypothetical protein